MACFRTWGLTSYRFRTLHQDPLTQMHESLYPRSGVKPPPTNRLLLKPQLSTQPGHSSGRLVGFCQCQHSPLAPFFRPGVGRCMCLPADGAPAPNQRASSAAPKTPARAAAASSAAAAGERSAQAKSAHRLSALPGVEVSTKWVVPTNVNFKRKYRDVTRYLPPSSQEVLEFVATKSSAQRQKERMEEQNRRELRFRDTGGARPPSRGGPRPNRR